MILDLETTFGDDQDLAQATGADYACANVYDLTASPLPIGPGEPVKVNIKVTEAFTSGTSSTIQFQLVSTDTAPVVGPPPTFGGTVEVVKETPAFADTVLVLGYQITLAAPIEDFTYRYMGVQIAIVTATTAGKIYAGIVCHEQTADSDWTSVTGF
jgi:hypothetical protein